MNSFALVVSVVVSVIVSIVAVVNHSVVANAVRFHTVSAITHHALGGIQWVTTVALDRVRLAGDAISLFEVVSRLA